MRRKSLRAIGALTVAFTVTGLMTAVPAYAATGPNIKVTAKAQEGRWLPGDAIPIEVTVANIGDTTANQVKGYGDRESGAYFAIEEASWGDLRSTDGATYAPGESRTYTLKGSVYTLTEGNPVLVIDVSGPGEADYSDNRSRTTVGLLSPDTTDRVAGVLYGDRNEDGKLSPGEGLAGAEARLIGPGMSEYLVAVTDAEGRFAFDAVPVGPNISWHFEKLPDGWVTGYPPSLRVDGSGQNTALEGRAIRPLTDALSAKITLDKTSYAVGETATATVTLTNAGTREISGLYAGCDPGGFERGLEVPAAQWGAFSYVNKAGKVAPGQSVVLKVTGTVPAKAGAYGQTGLDCWFDNDNSLSSGPYAYQNAKVPGVRADSRGRIWTDKNGNGQWDSGEQVPNVTVTLTTDGGKLVSLARTGADGWVTFPNVAVGVYQLRAIAPWRAVGDTDVYVIAPPYGFGDWHQQVVPR
ncbi:SdrD B-like domain-containing protein [Amycolatopsis japonica]|uniref:SdrD B-like domain-containing protein n=1 Tax=Amycolatopsis japonica TaxID=208439 RepID=UPI0033D7761E